MKNNKRYVAVLGMLLMVSGLAMPAKNVKASAPVESKGWNFSVTENSEGTYDRENGSEYSVTAWAKASNLVSVSVDGETVDEDEYEVKDRVYEDEDKKGGEGKVVKKKKKSSGSSRNTTPSAPTESQGTNMGIDWNNEEHTDGDSLAENEDPVPSATPETSMVVRDVQLVGEVYYYTEVIFSKAYMKTLSEGEHEISLKFSNGTAKAVVNVVGVSEVAETVKKESEPAAKAEDTAVTVPKTADMASTMLWIAFAAVSGAAVVYVTSKRKKVS